jgi:hypothetical protein
MEAQGGSGTWSLTRLVHLARSLGGWGCQVGVMPACRTSRWASMSPGSVVPAPPHLHWSESRSRPYGKHLCERQSGGARSAQEVESRGGGNRRCGRGWERGEGRIRWFGAMRPRRVPSYRFFGLHALNGLASWAHVDEQFLVVCIPTDCSKLYWVVPTDGSKAHQNYYTD